MLVHIPGQLQWLGFNASSSRKPSLISSFPAPELKVISYLQSPSGFLSKLLLMVRDSNMSTSHVLITDHLHRAFQAVLWVMESPWGQEPAQIPPPQMGMDSLSP